MLRHLNKYSHVYATVLIAVFFTLLTGGLVFREAGYSLRVDRAAAVTETISEAVNNPTPTWTVKEPTEAVEFITGPLVADTGQLCVFRLNDPDMRADWIIVPEATCYIDSSGSSLAFASNIATQYSIVAAVVEEGVPKILTHVCEYGLQPQPDPSPNPSPNPDPAPTPKPKPPAQNLTDWVSQNVPEAGRGQCAALAACYESAASGIEGGSIRSQEAAYSAIRTATQTKVNIDVWGDFLDALSIKVAEKLNGDSDVKKLGAILAEIAAGLKAVSDTGSPAETKISVPDILPFPTPGITCPDPTGKACQPQPQPRRRAM